MRDNDYSHLGFPGGSVGHPEVRREGREPLPEKAGESTPLLCLQGVPDLPGAPQDEAGLMRKFET